MKGGSIEKLKIITERYGRAEGAKNVVLHSKLHRARGGRVSRGGNRYACVTGGSKLDFRILFSYVFIGRSLKGGYS